MRFSQLLYDVFGASLPAAVVAGGRVVTAFAVTSAGTSTVARGVTSRIGACRLQKSNFTSTWCHLDSRLRPVN